MLSSHLARVAADWSSLQMMSTVSSPAIVPSTSSSDWRSMTLATYWAAPEGVCITARLRADATEVTNPDRIRDICCCADFGVVDCPYPNT